MSTTELLEMIEKLPDDKKKSVEKFIAKLSSEKVQVKNSKNLLIYNPEDYSSQHIPKVKREFGSLKGRLDHIADDFDSPLDDFNDYL